MDFLTLIRCKQRVTDHAKIGFVNTVMYINIHIYMIYCSYLRSKGFVKVHLNQTILHCHWLDWPEMLDWLLLWDSVATALPDKTVPPVVHLCTEYPVK